MTPINVFSTWQAVCKQVNVQQNGQYPPDTFITHYNEVSDWLFKKYAEDYQREQILSDFLAPFNVFANVQVVDQRGQNWGLSKYPSDYEFFLNASILRQKEEETCFVNSEYPIIDGNGKAKPYTDPDFAAMKEKFAGANVEERIINLVDTSRWPSCLNHLTKGPTWDEPKMTQFQGGFKVAPKGIQYILLSYLKTPVKATFAYTISSDDIVIYNSSGSTQLEWSEQVMPIFLGKLVTKYGILVDNAEVVKMGEELLKIALGA